MPKKTSTRGRVVGLIAAIVIGVGAAVGLVVMSSGGGEASSDYTPVNRHLSLVARDVLRAVADWQEANAPAPEGDGEDGASGTPPAPPPGSGPVALSVFIRDRPVDDLPDDLAIIVCTDMQPWIDLNSGKSATPMVAALSATALGSTVILYDGAGIALSPPLPGPAWLASGVTFTKADLAGSEKTVEFKRN